MSATFRPTGPTGASAPIPASPPTEGTPTHEVGVVDSSHSVAGIDYAANGERAVPYFCPFCAEEDLRPHARAPFRPPATELPDEHVRTEGAARDGAWHCRSCLRTFSVRFHGLAPLVAAPHPRADLDPAPPAPASPTPAPTDPTTGGPR